MDGMVAALPQEKVELLQQADNVPGVDGDGAACYSKRVLPVFCTTEKTRRTLRARLQGFRTAKADSILRFATPATLAGYADQDSRNGVKLSCLDGKKRSITVAVFTEGFVGPGFYRHTRGSAVMQQQTPWERVKRSFRRVEGEWE